MFLIVVQNSDYDEENMDPMFYNNDSSIDNEPEVGNTVIDDDNKFGVICDKNDDASPLTLPPESPPYNIICRVFTLLIVSCRTRRSCLAKMSLE